MTSAGQHDTDMVTSPSSISACDLEFCNHQAHDQISDGEIDSSSLLWKMDDDTDGKLNTRQKHNDSDSLKKEDEKLGKEEEMDITDGIGGVVATVDDELETMRKQGAIPKQYNKPYLPQPDSTQSNKDGK